MRVPYNKSSSSSSSSPLSSSSLLLLLLQLNAHMLSQWPSGLKARVFGRSLAGTAGLNPAGIMAVSLVQVLCVARWMSLRRTDVSPSPEESYRLWCVSVCDLETWRTRRPWPALGCCARRGKKLHRYSATTIIYVVVSGYRGHLQREHW